MAQLDVTDQGPSSKVRPRPRRSHQSIQANVNQDNDTEMKTSQNSATDAIIRNGKRLNPAIYLAGCEIGNARSVAILGWVKAPYSRPAMIVGDDIEYFDQTQAGLDDNHNLFKAYYLNEKELCKGEYIVKSGWTGVAKNQFIQISSNVILDWNQQSFTNVNSINQIKSKLCDYMGQSSYDLRHRCIDLRNEKRGLYLKINHIRESYGSFLHMQYGGAIRNAKSKGGGKARKIAVTIPYMAPGYYFEMIYCHNDKRFGTEELKIVKSSKGGARRGFHTYSTRKFGGNFPKEFDTYQWGISKGDSAKYSWVQGNGMQYDTYNISIEYEDEFGTFKYLADVCWRLGPELQWQYLKPTQNDNEQN